VPAAVRIPDDRTRLAQILGLIVESQASSQELLTEALGPAAVGEPTLRRLGGETGDESLLRRDPASLSRGALQRAGARAGA
jgi:hypothetical protein